MNTLALLTQRLTRRASVLTRRSMLVLGFALVFFLALGGLVFAAWQGAATGSGQAHASADLRGPGITASVIARSGGSAGVISQGSTYFVYANLNDLGSPPSGVDTAAANMSTITTGASTVPLTACTTSCTVDATTYGYRSAARVANPVLAPGSYTYSIAGIDHVGNTATVGGFTVDVDNDTTAPTLSTLGMFDTNANGKVDQVKATFSETLAATTLTTPWTLANVPSGGSLSSVSVAGAVATLTVNEGVGAASTAVGSFTVALAADADGIRDAAGNQSSFVATPPTDKAAPVLSATRTAGSHDDTFSGTTTENTGTITIKVYTGATATGTAFKTYAVTTFGGSSSPFTWTRTTGNNDLADNVQYTAQAIQLDAAGNQSNGPTVTFNATPCPGTGHRRRPQLPDRPCRSEGDDACGAVDCPVGPGGGETAAWRDIAGGHCWRPA